MKFRYIGAEPTEWFGHQWIKGVEHDITDEHAIRKLTGSVLFETVGEKPAKAAKAAAKPEPVSE